MLHDKPLKFAVGWLVATELEVSPRPSSPPRSQVHWEACRVPFDWPAIALSLDPIPAGDP